MNIRVQVIFLGIPLILLLFMHSYPFEKVLRGKCTKVLDGDTIELNGRRIRLAYIDAPEREQTSYDGVSIGEMSKNFLKAKILGKRIKVHYLKRGFYGRIIGVVWLKNNINELLVRSGMAVIYKWETTALYRSLELEARLKRKGIFATDGFDRPGRYRRSKKKAISKKMAL